MGTWHVAGQYASRVRTLTAVSTPHPAAFGRALSGELGGDQAQRSWYTGFFQQPEVPEETLLKDDAAALRRRSPPTADAPLLPPALEGRTGP